MPPCWSGSLTRGRWETMTCVQGSRWRNTSSSITSSQFRSSRVCSSESVATQSCRAEMGLGEEEHRSIDGAWVRTHENQSRVAVYATEDDVRSGTPIDERVMWDKYQTANNTLINASHGGSLVEIPHQFISFRISFDKFYPIVHHHSKFFALLVTRGRGSRCYCHLSVSTSSHHQNRGV